jgi:hypothetical protein
MIALKKKTQAAKCSDHRAINSKDSSKDILRQNRTKFMTGLINFYDLAKNYLNSLKRSQCPRVTLTHF